MPLYSVRVPTPRVGPAPPDLPTALDQLGTMEAMLAYKATRPGFAAAMLEESLLHFP